MSSEPDQGPENIAPLPDEDGQDCKSAGPVDVEVNSSVGRPRHQAQESGRQFDGQQKKEKDVGPRVRHGGYASRKVCTYSVCTPGKPRRFQGCVGYGFESYLILKPVHHPFESFHGLLYIGGSVGQ